MRNEYLPKKAVIERIVEESADTKTFTLKLKQRMRYNPGQFLMLSLPGYGEAPFTFASAARKDGRFEISVRKVGSLTFALHTLKEKDIIGVRGPYGNWFPSDKLKKKIFCSLPEAAALLLCARLSNMFSRAEKTMGRLKLSMAAASPRIYFIKRKLKPGEETIVVMFILPWMSLTRLGAGHAGWSVCCCPRFR